MIKKAKCVPKRSGPIQALIEVYRPEIDQFLQRNSVSVSYRGANLMRHRAAREKSTPMEKL